MADNEPFRAIIVGAGATGLALAHCLSKAGINFVVLEKGIVAPPLGNTITLFPNGLRILHQLRCLDAVEAEGVRMGDAANRDSRGTAFMHVPYFDVIAELTGYYTRTINRQTFLQVLFDTLPDKSKVFQGACVEAVNGSRSGVTGILSDGREFHGDIVIGADGVHSKIRGLMAKADVEGGEGSSAPAKSDFTTTYCVIIGLSKPIPGLELKGAIETTSFKDVSFIWTVMDDEVSYSIYLKLPKERQYRSPDRTRFTDEDLERAAAKIAQFPLNERVKFKEVWAARTRAHMVPLEEGVVERWFSGRAVLAGDAAHKVTPNAGMGGNMAIEDAACLTNLLHQAITEHQGCTLTDGEIQDVFQRYHAKRVGRVSKIVHEGGQWTRFQAYDTVADYLTFRWLSQLVGLRYIAAKVAKTCLRGPKLEFVDFEGNSGSMPWRESEPLGAESSKRARWTSGRVNLVVVLSLLLAVFTWLFNLQLMDLATAWFVLLGTLEKTSRSEVPIDVGSE